MKMLVFLSILTFTSLKPKHSGFPIKDIKSNLIGKSVLSFTTKEKMDELLLSALSDKEAAEKINKILSEKKFSYSVCYGIWDDANTYCLKSSDNRKGSLCGAYQPKITSFTFFNRYFMIYDCNNYQLYYMAQM